MNSLSCARDDRRIRIINGGVANTTPIGMAIMEIAFACFGIMQQRIP